MFSEASVSRGEGGLHPGGSASGGGLPNPPGADI